MKHTQILEQLTAVAESDANTLGYLLFGSVATGTQREDSDIDVMTVLRENKPPWGMSNTVVDGIKVGNLFFTYDVLDQSLKTVPYLLHPLGEAKILFDRNGQIRTMIEEITRYFEEHEEVTNEWNHSSDSRQVKQDAEPL